MHVFELACVVCGGCSVAVHFMHLQSQSDTYSGRQFSSQAPIALTKRAPVLGAWYLYDKDDRLVVTAAIAVCVYISRGVPKKQNNNSHVGSRYSR